MLDARLLETLQLRGRRVFPSLLLPSTDLRDRRVVADFVEVSFINFLEEERRVMADLVEESFISLDTRLLALEARRCC